MIVFFFSVQSNRLAMARKVRCVIRTLLLTSVVQQKRQTEKTRQKKIKNKNVASSVGIFHSKQAWLCFGPCRIDVLEADDMGEQRSVWMEKLKTVAGTVLLVTLVRYI